MSGNGSFLLIAGSRRAVFKRLGLGVAIAGSCAFGLMLGAQQQVTAAPILEELEVSALDRSHQQIDSQDLSAGIPIPHERPLPELSGGRSPSEPAGAINHSLSSGSTEGQVIPVSGVARSAVGSLQNPSYTAAGVPLIADGGRLPRELFANREAGRFFLPDKFGDKIYFTVETDLQDESKRLLEQYRVPWGALVAIDPRTGRVLAMASHSEEDPDAYDLAVRSGFPAASLFKVITAAAAVERSGLSNDSEIYFRGGNYTLSRYNYNPDPRRDRRRMSLGIALGKSCNPAFARVALNNLSSETLAQYAASFGFNTRIPFEAPLERSIFLRPTDEFELARTAAGFQNATISPLHAAMVAAAISNNGVMMRPHLVDTIIDLDAGGRASYRARPTPLRQVVLGSTARELMVMMANSVTDGTARKHFARSSNPSLRAMQVAGKTGTLRGPDPEGVYHWFIAAAPAEDPQVAIAALVIDPGNARINGTGIGRRFLEYYFSERHPSLEAKLSRSKSHT